MKTKFRILIAVWMMASTLFLIPANAQINQQPKMFQLPQHFVLREQKASPQIKQLLVEQRKFIADRKLGF